MSTPVKTKVAVIVPFEEKFDPFRFFANTGPAVDVSATADELQLGVQLGAERFGDQQPDSDGGRTVPAVPGHDGERAVPAVPGHVGGRTVPGHDGGRAVPAVPGHDDERAVSAVPGHVGGRTVPGHDGGRAVPAVPGHVDVETASDAAPVRLAKCSPDAAQVDVLVPASAAQRTCWVDQQPVAAAAVRRGTVDASLFRRGRQAGAR